MRAGRSKKIGIFGGSFDPIHFGHLNLAISLRETHGLDEVLFIPAGTSPFKTSAPPIAGPEHRLKMLQLALKDIEGFRILDWELKVQGPSYTIDTVRKLAEDPSVELHLLIGSDQAAELHLWKEGDAIARLAPPLIAPRMIKEKWEMPILEISSTLVRKRLSQKKYCGHLVPASVLDYIARHNLYL